MHRFITLIACTSALTETRVRTRVMSDAHVLARTWQAVVVVVAVVVAVVVTRTRCYERRGAAVRYAARTAMSYAARLTIRHDAHVLL